jgi:hypothetical protein
VKFVRNFIKQFFFYSRVMYSKSNRINLKYGWIINRSIDSEAIHYTGKKSRFFKVFKVAGKKCITTVSKENNEQKVTTRPWWISTTKSSMIR